MILKTVNQLGHRTGTKIAYSSIQSTCDPTKAFCPSDIKVMNADGTQVKVILDDGRTNIYPVWSPDGKRVGYTVERWVHSNNISGVETYSINTYDLATSEVHRNLEVKNSNPQHCSPIPGSARPCDVFDLGVRNAAFN